MAVVPLSTKLVAMMATYIILFVSLLAISGISGSDSSSVEDALICLVFVLWQSSSLSVFSHCSDWGSGLTFRETWRAARTRSGSMKIDEGFHIVLIWEVVVMKVDLRFHIDLFFEKC